MGRILNGSATTTEAIRRAIQNREDSLRALSERYGINQKAVAKWRADIGLGSAYGAEGRQVDFAEPR